MPSARKPGDSQRANNFFSSVGGHLRSLLCTDTSQLDMQCSPLQDGASAFHGAHDFSIGGNAHVVNVGSMNVSNHHGGTQGLDILQPFVSFDAFYDSSAQDPHRQCHPGTRENVLNQMRNWINNPDMPQRILWLHGPAGVGKSAIAQTISRSFGREKVAATFFFFRSDPRRNNGNLLFPTITWQLAKSVPGARDQITSALNDDPDIPRKEIEGQFKLLLAGPLSALRETAAGAPQAHSMTQVVIIDGVDECSDQGLQQRFLELIGGAASRESCAPVRFIISSRPEAHIKDTLHQFTSITLPIDLANIDDAYKDIEKYLKAEFTRIASMQEIDPETWPSRAVIDSLVFKSSGQFVYASTVIKFVRDEYSSAPSQLDIVLGLKPSNGESPFADLDALYLEILGRQRHQDFLNQFLTMLVGRNGTNFSGNDDALLLNMDQKELHRKLRGMHSLLRLEDKSNIDVHHRSFLDFLQEQTRSGQYYIHKKSATRRFLELIVDALARHASRVLKEPDYHESDHFAPEFGDLFRDHPREIKLHLEDWEVVLHPLVGIKDESLKFPNTSPWKRGLCDKCSTFYIIDDLFLHLALLRGISHPIILPSECEAEGLAVLALTTSMTGEGPSMPVDLDSSLSSLLLALRDRNAFKSMTTIGLFFDVLCFSCPEVASKVRSMLDGQNLIDFIHYMTSTKWAREPRSQGTARKATLLAIEIYARIPTIPRICLDGAAISDDGKVIKYQGKRVVTWGCSSHGINPLSQRPLMWATVAHENIFPLLGIYEKSDPSPAITLVYSYPENGMLRQWRQKSNPPIVDMQRRILEVAKAIQYFHSLGLVLLNYIQGNDIGLDFEFHAQVPALCISLRYHQETPEKYRNLPRVATDLCAYEIDVFVFGCLFYEVYFNINISYPPGVSSSRRIVTKRPDVPEIAENAWKLIQRCCAEERKMRPTMDQVVEEMESWNLV